MEKRERPLTPMAMVGIGVLPISTIEVVPNERGRAFTLPQRVEDHFTDTYVFSSKMTSQRITQGQIIQIQRDLPHCFLIIRKLFDE